MTDVFFELIRVALGRSERLGRVLSDDEWRNVMELAMKQTLTGVAFTGVERLPAEERPPKEVLLQWYSMVSRTEAMNGRMDALCVRLQERFLQDGLHSCILKGQGVAAFHERPERRVCGDIDIWVESGRESLIKRYRGMFKEDVEVRFHHMDFPVMRETSVELHFFPSWMNSPLKNRRLQRWFAEQAERQMGHEVRLRGGERIYAPTRGFNLVYVLLHIFRHLFEEGIGLRQILDYYYISIIRNGQSPSVNQLRLGNGEQADHSSSGSDAGLGMREEDEARRVLKDLGLTRFAKALMWVMGEVFGLEREAMLVEPDEKEGRYLLDEVMKAGNFGKYDPRFAHLQEEKAWHIFVRKQRHIWRLLRHYPSETLWSPFFNIRQRLWRWRKGYL